LESWRVGKLTGGGLDRLEVGEVGELTGWRWGSWTVGELES